MKKILFILLICVIKLSAYEYKIASGNSDNTYFIYYYDNQGKFYIKSNSGTGESNYLAGTSNSIYTSLGHIKFQDTVHTFKYISSSEFDDILKNDINFLNSFYTQNDTTRNSLMNYLYNDKSFRENSYILYNDYELLYNSDGLAVESIVGGVWAGLYDDNQKSKSGALYDKNGSMIYYNGKAVDPVTSFLVWLKGFTNKVVIDAFEEIRKSHVTVIIISVVLVLGLFRLVLELLPSSISPRRRRYYGGGRGSLPDYGAGSQVAASVRARLAAKNRALKSRSENQSAVSRSLQNGIIFDLENDR